MSANNRLKIGTRLDDMHGHAQLVDRLLRELKARGVRSIDANAFAERVRQRRRLPPRDRMHALIRLEVRHCA